MEAPIISSYAGATPPGSIIPLIFYISIGPNTPLGTYNAQFHVTGRTIYNTVIDQDFNVTIDLRGRADLQFDIIPKSLAPGMINNMTPPRPRGAGFLYWGLGC
jgi:hypothetical protein